MSTVNERADWDTYFLSIAEKVASRATCPRASVGAVIVKDKRILTTGYNGALAGEPHCTEEVGCIVEHGHCARAVHAEINAVAQAARFGIAIEGATAYVWDSLERGSACPECLKALRAAGVVRIVAN